MAQRKRKGDKGNKDELSLRPFVLRLNLELHMTLKEIADERSTLSNRVSLNTLIEEMLTEMTPKLPEYKLARQRALRNIAKDKRAS